MSALILVLFGILILGLALKIRKDFNDPAWKGLPGPSYTLPFFGNMFELRNSGVGVFHSKCVEKYGPVFRYNVIGRTRVVVSDPALVKEVLIENEKYDKSFFGYRLLSEITGDGVLTEQDEGLHRTQRNILGPVFATKNLKMFASVFVNKAELLVEDWKQKSKTGKPIAIKDDVFKTTGDAMGMTFGYYYPALRDYSSLSVFHLFEIIGNGFKTYDFMPILKYFVPYYHIRKNAVSSLDKALHTIIGEKQEEEKETKQQDMLDIMMESQNKEGQTLTKTELANNVQTFFFAGYKTISVCMMWTLYLLAKHSDVQKKLYDEILSVIGQRKPTADDIEKMPYMSKVIKESLRFRPPIPYVVRSPSSDVNLGSYFIPKDTIITISMYLQHHYSPVWERPEEFNPERWSQEDTETSLFGSYIPFALGARNCIGSKLAVQGVKVMLITLLQNFTFQRDERQKEPTILSDLSLALMPQEPIRLLVSPHKNIL